MSHLLEREEQLGDLARWWSDAESGSGAIVLLAGAAGAGKTALIGAFSEGRETWTGWCDPLVTPRPLGPLIDLAAHLGPEVGLAQGDPYAAYAALLAQLAARTQPVLVVIEDAHWADAATLDLLLFLGRRIGSTRTLIVVTFRDDETSPDQPLQRVLAELSRQQHVVHRLSVGPLSVDALVDLTAGSELDAGDLFATTGGNPFFATEVIAAGGGLPASVRDAVLGRLAALDGQARAIAEAVSIEPRGLSTELLTPWTGLDPEALDHPDLPKLLAVDRRAIRFTHELARRAVYDSLPDARRSRLHRSLLELLVATDSVDAARLAHHAIATGDAALVLPHARRAGLEASLRNATTEAVSFLLAARDHSASLDPAERSRLHLELVEALGLAGRQADALTEAGAALLAAEQSGEALAVGAALTAKGRAEWRGGDPASARESMRRARDTLRPLGATRAYATALTVSAQHLMLARQHDPAIAHVLEAGRVAAEVGTETDRIRVRMVEGTTEVVTGDADRGVGLLLQARESAQVDGDQRLVAECLMQLGSGAGEVRRYPAALGWLRELLTASRARDQDYAVSYARSWQARILLEQGRWSEASETATDVLGVASAPITRVTALAVLGRLRVRRGDPRPAEPLTEALAMDGLELQHRWPALCALAEQHWLDDDAAATTALLAPAYALALGADSPWATGEIALWLWRVGDLDKAPERAAAPYAAQIGGDWRRAAAQWQALGCPYEEAMALYDGDDDAVLSATRIFDDLGAAPAAAHARARLRAHGVSVPRGPRSTTREHRFGLTAREAEIHELLLAGLTNPEIAQRLVISRRTVEHHVSAVLAKTGASSRRGLSRDG